MEKVLVAGGAGFIGSNLCKLLLERYEVVCIDDYSSGVKANVEHLKDLENFRLIEHNIIKPINPFLESEVKDVGYIFHLASRASPKDYQSHPMHTVLSNTQGTINLLELCRKTDACFLYASTSEVYGDPLEHPQKETYRGNVNTTGVRACYDESKRLGETITSIYVREYGVDARIVRIFNTYGPGMKPDDGRVVSNFITQALRGQNITVYGNGTQTRSFCYVSDMVEGIYKAMFTENTKDEVINLGSPNESTIKELAYLVKEITGSKSNIIFCELPEDDPCKRNPDISKARRLLKWNPKVDLRDGLSETVKYFKAII